MVPGGGVEPPCPEGRRILSLIYGILHGAAHSRNRMHNIFIYNIYEHDHDCMALHETVQNPGSNMHQNMHQVACIPATRLDLYPNEESAGNVEERHAFCLQGLLSLCTDKGRKLRTPPQAYSRINPLRSCRGLELVRHYAQIGNHKIPRCHSKALCGGRRLHPDIRASGIALPGTENTITSVPKGEDSESMPFGFEISL